MQSSKTQLNLEFLVERLTENVIRDAVLELDMDQLENELFVNLNVSLRKTNLSEKTIQNVSVESFGNTEVESSIHSPEIADVLKTPTSALTKPRTRKRRPKLTLCQAVCATTLQQFPRLLRNPQLLLSLTVQQVLSMQALMDEDPIAYAADNAGDADEEDESDDENCFHEKKEAFVSPASTLICREQIGYDQPAIGFGPLENYSNATEHYDMIPLVEWNCMIPGLQARPNFLKRLKRDKPSVSAAPCPRYDVVEPRKPTVPSVFTDRPCPDTDADLLQTKPDPESVKIKTEKEDEPSGKKCVATFKRELFENIVSELLRNLPNLTRSSAIKRIRDVREKSGGLSGKSADEIIQTVLKHALDKSTD